LRHSDFIGSLARIEALAKRGDLNGRKVLLVEYMQDRKRFRAQCPGVPGDLLILPSNLVEASSPLLGRCPVCNDPEVAELLYDCSYCRAFFSDRWAALSTNHPFFTWKRLLYPSQ